MSTTATAAAEEKSPRFRINLGAILMEGRALVALLLIIVIFASMNDNYLAAGNLATIAKDVAFNAIIALGMLLVILKGGIDLSVGSTVGLTGAVAGNLFAGVSLPLTDAVMYPSLWVIVVIAVAVGMLVGWINGLLISRLNLAPFIVTLGMLYVGRGLTQVLLGGTNITNELRGEPGLNNEGLTAGSAHLRLGDDPPGSDLLPAADPHALRPLALRHRQQRARRRALRGPGAAGQDAGLYLHRYVCRHRRDPADRQYPLRHCGPGQPL